MEVFRKPAVKENKKREESADSETPEVHCSVSNGLSSLERGKGLLITVQTENQI